MSPPRHPAAKPLSRWAETWRITLAAVFGVVLWFSQFAVDGDPATWVPLVDLVLGVGALVLLHFRRRWPVLVAALTVAATALSGLAAGAAVIAFISLVTTRRWRPIAAVAGIGIASVVGAGSLLNDPDPEVPWWGVAIFAAAIWGVAVVVGLYIAARRELVETARARAETAEREQASRVEQARTNERTQIAREMHDVLAHRISLVAMHAGAMTYRSDLTREELLESAQVVQANAHLALTDLRDVLGVLRETPVAGAAPAPPQPTLADLPELVGSSRQAGNPVELTSTVADEEAIPDLVGRTAYRIVQEGLTNARKHAAGLPVSVSLDGSPSAGLSIEVRNPLVAVNTQPYASPAAVPGAGMGLVGLAERAGLAGGRLTSGPDAGQFVVRAWLPWTG